MSIQPNQPNPEPENIVPMPEPKPRRVRGDAFWSRLTPEHRKQLHTWLFEERITYRDAHQRVREKLGLDCSLASIGRCYQHMLREQALDEADDAKDTIKAILETDVLIGDLSTVSIQIIATRLLQKAMDHGDTKDLCALGRLVLAAEAGEVRRQRLQLARDKFEFHASGKERKDWRDDTSMYGEVDTGETDEEFVERSKDTVCGRMDLITPESERLRLKREAHALAEAQAKAQAQVNPSCLASDRINSSENDKGENEKPAQPDKPAVTPVNTEAAKPSPATVLNANPPAVETKPAPQMEEKKQQPEKRKEVVPDDQVQKGTWEHTGY